MEQESRVAELRSLAARVAAETGSRALQADADALARRLQLVAGAVQALADLGEARQLARAKAQHAKEKFCDMRQVSLFNHVHHRPSDVVVISTSIKS